MMVTKNDISPKISEFRMDAKIMKREIIANYPGFTGPSSFPPKHSTM